MDKKKKKKSMPQQMMIIYLLAFKTPVSYLRQKFPAVFRYHGNGLQDKVQLVLTYKVGQVESGEPWSVRKKKTPITFFSFFCIPP